MEWKPKTEEEVQMADLLEPGYYAAEVLEVEERDDKKGRPFWMLKLAVYGDDRQAHVWDNISPAWMEFKFRHFFVSAGLEALYDKGMLAVSDLSELLYKKLFVEIGIQPAKGEYGPKNIVKDYVDRAIAAAANQASVDHAAKAAEVSSDTKKDEDLPF